MIYLSIFLPSVSLQLIFCYSSLRVTLVCIGSWPKTNSTLFSCAGQPYSFLNERMAPDDHAATKRLMV